MLAQTWTSSKHILESNSTMMATHIFVLSLHPNLSVVLALLTNCHITSHNHHTNSALMPWCPLTLPRGYLNRSTLIRCIWRILIARFSPNQFAAPAATIQAFVNGAIGIRLPSHKKWVQAYSNDSEMSIIRNLILNPSKINTATFNMVKYNFRSPLGQSLIFIENGMLFYKEPICGG